MLFVDQKRKANLLQTILREPRFERVLVFTRTKHRADRVARKLARVDIPADAIHGNKTQNARTQALKAFRGGRTRVLVATDIAARGIDVDDISHVINYELPNEPESYVHRIGRTARAGNEGNAISFCAGDERDYLCDIEKTMGLSIEVVRTHSCHSQEAERGRTDGEDGVQSRKRKTRSQANARGGNRRRRGHSRGRARAQRGSAGR